MKRKLIFWSVLFASAVAFCASSALAEVHFKQLSFAEAKKLAAKEHKDVMIDFYTGWCGWCKVLDKQTYSDEAVGKTADAKFVSIKLDAENGEGKDLARQYKITGYPTIVFFTSTGKEIDRVVGYEDAPKFLRSMKNAAAGGTASVIEEVSNTAKPCKDPSKWLVAADYYAKNANNKKALDAFTHAIQLDPDNKKNCRAEATYGQAFLTEGEEQWLLLERATGEYPKNGAGSQAVMMLLKHFFELGRVDDAIRTIERWTLSNPRDAETFNYFAWAAAEKGVALDRAEDYANRAMSLATDPVERAGYTDTRAEVLFKTGRTNEAVLMEDEALHFVDSVKNKKLYKEMQAQKAKFEAAQAGGQSTGLAAPITDPAQATQH